jgi:hypothetical protein
MNRKLYPRLSRSFLRLYFAPFIAATEAVEGIPVKPD